MRQKKTKVLRRFAKRISSELVTTYKVGKPPVFNTTNETYVLSARVVHPGQKFEPGVPTVMNHCVRTIYKSLKENYKNGNFTTGFFEKGM